MKKKILITGATGLLGDALVNEFLKNEFHVLGQYHKKRPERKKNCEWIRADFSELKGVRNFLSNNRKRFIECTHLINNYGPITKKKIKDLKPEDFMFDFFTNVVTVFEITGFLIKNSNLGSVMNIGFEFTGKIKPYKEIMTYVMAKNSLLLLTESLAKEFTNIRFNMVSPATMEGASIKPESGRLISPQKVAGKIYELMSGKGTGTNYVL